MDQRMDPFIHKSESVLAEEKSFHRKTILNILNMTYSDLSKEALK